MTLDLVYRSLLTLLYDTSSRIAGAKFLLLILVRALLFRQICDC